MSRVDEAMRRAAEEANANRAGEDTAALAREPFPIELGEHRRGHPSSPRPTLAIVGESSKPPDDPGGAGWKVGSLLERVDARVAEKLVTDRRVLPVSREQYRRLAAVLHAAQEASGIKVVMVASAAEGEGKTLTAANLALTLSESYQRSVVLVDADLRRPALQNLFGLPSSIGLSEGLIGREDQKLKVWPVFPTSLSVLPAGQPTGDPMAALTSERMRRVIDEAKGTFDWVIIDTPPLLMLPDAQILGGMVDGVILVIKADKTPHDLVQRAVSALGDARILGTVLNCVQTTPVGSDYEYFGRTHRRPRKAIVS